MKRRVLKLAGIISKQFYGALKGNENRLHEEYLHKHLRW